MPLRPQTRSAFPGDLDGEARFAHAAASDERDQPRVESASATSRACCSLPMSAVSG